MVDPDSEYQPLDDDDQQVDSVDALLRSAARTSQQLRAGTLLADGRFRIVRALGQGGMGTVYEALDSTRGEHVALKTLTRCEPEQLYRLKNEFRSLADVAHPNLVALREFICDQNLWFFSMDLLRGESFVRYVRGAPSGALAPTVQAGAPGYDEARLRSALAQLVHGVVALHQAGKLHCDLKPANVIVSPAGQLTILDFGLVSERVGPSSGHTLGPQWAGTPGYMAPEQMEARTPTPATDYYGIGVMLYECLTGTLPSRMRDTSVSHSAGRPALPETLRRGGAADLAELCSELLAADASQRPSEQDLLLRACTRDTARPSVPAPAHDAPLLGRDRERALLASFEAGLTPSAPHVVLVAGPSGIGKTRLVREFVRDRPGPGAALLAGRCYERESVPFNAFDSLIDGLSRYLHALPPLRAATLMPRDVQLLAELFPVLGRVACVESMPAPLQLPSDPLALRRRAFAALKELLSRISDVSSLVLSIDDMHWADSDSLQLLEALLVQPGAPRMLVIGVYHSDHAPRAALVSALCERQSARFDELALGPLAHADRLALIAGEVTLAAEDAERMARESNGNPFFLNELIAAGVASQGASDLRAVILARAARLSDEVRRLLDLLCVAGAPLELAAALAAAGLSQHGQAVITELRNERWLRIEPSGRGQSVALYHSRLHEILLAALPAAERTRLVHDLARCLEERADADLERVARYWLEAGLTERAALGFARAAQRAEQSLAFVSAARLYALALEHGAFVAAERARLTVAMGEALACAGHAQEAASAYLAAAAGSGEPDSVLELRRKAAQLLLGAGALDAGTEVLRSVLADVGLAYPESADEALTWLRSADEALAHASTLCAAEELAVTRRRADACWAAGPALGSYDFVRAGYFARRGLLLAQETGDDLRIARGLAMVATSVASGGDTERALALAERSRALAASDPVALANAELVLGQVRLFAGEFAEARAACDRALALFQAENAGESLEVHLCGMFANMALHLSGQLTELVSRSREQLEGARARGHIQAEASLRVLGVALGRLVEDDVAGARQQGALSAALWPQAQLHGERFKVLRLEAWCDLYEGEEARAHARWAAARDQGALLLSSRYWRFWWNDLAASTSLAAAARTGDAQERARLLDDADQAIGALATLAPSYVAAPLVLYRAARAHLSGRRDDALDGLRSLCSDPRPLVAASARARLGALVGGPEGAAVRAMGMQELAGWVKNPARWIAFTLPGFGAG